MWQTGMRRVTSRNCQKRCCSPLDMMRSYPQAPCESWGFGGGEERARSDWSLRKVSTKSLSSHILPLSVLGELGCHLIGCRLRAPLSKPKGFRNFSSIWIRGRQKGNASKGLFPPPNQQHKPSLRQSLSLRSDAGKMQGRTSLHAFVWQRGRSRVQIR